MDTRLLFNTSAAIEFLTGVTFLVAPMLLLGFLLSDGESQVGTVVARVLGVGLLSLGIACWESLRQNARLTTRIGLCTYNIGVAIVLTVVGASDTIGGPILWPVMAIHAIIGTMMLWAIRATRNNELTLNTGENQ